MHIDYINLGNSPVSFTRTLKSIVENALWSKNNIILHQRTPPSSLRAVGDIRDIQIFFRSLNCLKQQSDNNENLRYKFCFRSLVGLTNAVL